MFLQLWWMQHPCFYDLTKAPIKYVIIFSKSYFGIHLNFFSTYFLPFVHRYNQVLGNMIHILRIPSYYICCEWFPENFLMILSLSRDLRKLHLASAIWILYWVPCSFTKRDCVNKNCKCCIYIMYILFSYYAYNISELLLDKSLKIFVQILNLTVPSLNTNSTSKVSKIVFERVNHHEINIW